MEGGKRQEAKEGVGGVVYVSELAAERREPHWHNGCSTDRVYALHPRILDRRRRGQ